MGLYFWGKLQKSQKYFLFFISFSIVVEGISVFTYLNDIENHWIFEIFIICDLIFFIWFFTVYAVQPKWLKSASYLFLFLVLIWELLIKLIKHKPQFESIFFIVVFLFFVLQSIQVILKLLDHLEISPFKNYLFWIAASRLIYYSFILFIYIYPNLLENGFKNEFFTFVFIAINTSANILANTLYAISFYERRG